MINNNNWESGGNVPDTNWVNEELNQTLAPFKVIVGHVSPNDTDRFTPEIIDDWEAMVTNAGVDYFFHGHNHNPAEGTFGSTTKITIGAPSKRVFFELSFSAGGLTHQKIDF